MEGKKEKTKRARQTASQPKPVSVKKRINKTWQAILDHQGAFIVTEPNLFM